MSTSPLKLGIPGFSYPDLNNPERLAALYRLWCERARTADAELFARYEAYRAAPDAIAPEALSSLITALAPSVSQIVAELFNIGAERDAALSATAAELIVFRFKDDFCKRRALKRKVTDAVAAQAAGEKLLASLGIANADLLEEAKVARVVCALLDREIELKKRPVDDPELVGVRDQLAVLEGWLVAISPTVKSKWLSVRMPRTTPEPFELVQISRPRADLPELIVGPEHHRRARDGFKLTDRRMAPLEVLAEVDYCLYCHDRDKDSCSKGLHEKSGAIKPNALGVELNGCPLDEKISEMHFMKRQGDSIAALALVCMDNPMLPGTGHRICNDCMKSCIYQKQEPVNIPQIETGVLTDVLALPWGFEIYGLLTRWNPLNVRRPYALPYRGKKVLVVGLGPAGYTLAHHLLNEGFGVVGIDGLKIEPLPMELVTQPVRDFTKFQSELDERVLAGFGGVSEYGITVRWDKNFLTVVYATLARRETFRCYGGIRLGGTTTLDEIWTMGFDHVAIAVGAGKPTIIDVKNNLMRGIRKASDFLMGLQLTGAYKRSSLANLQVRLPALVIGGGLTGIDTATELLAYYVVQVEKMLARYEDLSSRMTDVEVRKRFDDEERDVLDEMLGHGRQIRAERARAASKNDEPRFQPLLDSWGGVSLVYRKRMVDSPAYRLNHEEVEKCLEEGVGIIECMSPVEALADERGAVRAMTFERQSVDAAGKWTATGQIIELAARTVCVAAGTSPNTIYEKEYPGTFKLDRKGFFAPHRVVTATDGAVSVEADAAGFFTSYVKDGKTVSYYGDNHPKYAGSVVKAMASAKHGFSHVAALFAAAKDAPIDEWSALTKTLDDEWIARVVEVNRLTPTIVEVIVRAPAAARRFRPGQFYRLQNFETTSATIAGTRLAMEGLALTGAWSDADKGLLSLIVLEMGSSSRLCAALTPGEAVVVMGPTGTPTEIPSGESILLAGGGLGNAVLFSIGKALRAAGSRVLYFAAYRKKEDVFRRDDIEAAADEVVWAVDSGDPIEPRRPADRAFVGNVVQAMMAYAEGKLGPNVIPLSSMSRVIAIGSDRMMRAVKDARHGVLAPHLQKNHIGIGSINSPMQCMMKEICAQCLQKHVDPATGKETIIFSCFNQDQELDHVDFDNLASRLRANTVQEKLSNMWLERLLGERDIRRI